MIKFLGTRAGRPLLGFGLSRANCEKLLEGRPIFIDPKVMLMDVEKLPDLNEATLLIFGGETEADMERALGQFVDLPRARHEHHEEN